MATQPLTNLIDPPPRLTGDSAHDTVAVIQWLNAFYAKGVLSGALLQTQNFPTTLAEQFDALFAQDYPGLAAMAELVGEADKFAYYTDAVTFALADLTSYARSLLAGANGAAVRSTLGLGSLATKNTVAEADIDADAVTYAKLQNVSATDKLLGRASAGAGNAEEIACTAAGRALIDDADAAAQRATLGLGSMAVEAVGINASVTTAALVGKTLTFVNGICTGFA